MIDARTAPNGSVATHESRMSRTLLQSASCLRSRPMPKIPPDVTCVVDTGEPERRGKCHECRRYHIGGDCLGCGHWCNLLAQSMCYANCAQRSSDCDYQSYEEIIQLYRGRGSHQ